MQDMAHAIGHLDEVPDRGGRGRDVPAAGRIVSVIVIHEGTRCAAFLTSCPPASS